MTLLRLVAQLLMASCLPTSNNAWVLIIAISLIATARKWPQRDTVISPLLAWLSELAIFGLGGYRLMTALNGWSMVWSILIIVMALYGLLNLWTIRKLDQKSGS